MRTKRILALATAITMAFSLTACAPSNNGTAASTEAVKTTEGGDKGAASPSITLIAAHVNDENSSYHYGLTKFKEKLEELSGGTMTVEIHPNGELGGDESELIEKVATDTVDVIVVSPGDLSNAVPQVDFLALPFLYSSVDHWKRLFPVMKLEVTLLIL